MILYKPYSYVAQTGYSCDAYGAGAYSECSTSTGGGGGTPSGGGGLADTGYEVLLPIFLAIALLIAALILAFKKWRRKKVQESQPLATQSQPQDQDSNLASKEQ